MFQMVIVTFNIPVSLKEMVALHKKKRVPPPLRASLYYSCLAVTYLLALVRNLS